MPEPSTPPTIRQHLEAIRRERDRIHINVDDRTAYVTSMTRVTEHAVAALDLLNNAEWTYGDHYRLVPEPEDAT